MRADMQKLKEFAAQNNLNFETIAKKIGIDRSTFYRKLNSDGEKFTIGEVHKMVEAIPMSKEDAASIFLCENSH